MNADPKLLEDLPLDEPRAPTNFGGHAPSGDPAADAVAELDDPLSFDDPRGNGYDDGAGNNVIPRQREMFRIPSGKYQGLILPRMIGGVNPSYYEKVLALKDEIERDPEFQRQAGTIAHTYAALRREAEAKTAELSELKLRLTAVMLLMIDQFENEGETGLTLDTGDKVRWNPEPHLVVTDKEAFRQWCLSQGLERSMTLPWMTANKMVKQMLLDGAGEPPGAECFMRPKVSFTKGEK